MDTKLLTAASSRRLQNVIPSITYLSLVKKKDMHLKIINTAADILNIIPDKLEPADIISLDLERDFDDSD